MANDSNPVSEDFTAQFIDKCLAQGFTSPGKMGEIAKQEVAELEIQIKELDRLRFKQSKLREICRQFSPEVAKIKKTLPIINLLPKEQLEPVIQEICYRICKLIEDATEDLTPHQIRDAVSCLEDHKLGYSAIKSLWDRGIVSRQECGSKVLIVKGSKWGQRAEILKFVSPILTEKPL